MQNKHRHYRVAIVGSGPAAMYAAEHLLEQREVPINIDMFERLPSPWGLVRAGVAPDHPEKKLIADRLFSFVFKRPELRFFGNVEIGKHIQHKELADWYDAVIYATGADGDSRMNITGENLSGCWAAREFVAWYNGHPDASKQVFDLSCERAVIVGNGNVALDVARILTMSVEALQKTDIADYALDALRHSKIREVVILGRRGHLQGAFNNPELEEFEHLEGVDIVVELGRFAADTDVQAGDVTWETRRKVETLKRFSKRPLNKNNKRIVLRFLASPLELLGDGQLQQLRLIENKLADEQGRMQAIAAGEEQLIDTGLVLRAIGYRGTPFAGLPFDEQRGVIKNEAGRVNDTNILAGVYVTGWIRRGANGVIGTNKKCARDTVRGLLDDINNNKLPAPTINRVQIDAEIAKRQANVVDKTKWFKIDHSERQAGRLQGRPRVKLTDVEAMLTQANTH